MRKKISISKSYFSLSTANQLDDSGNEYPRDTTFVFHPYKGNEENCLIIENKDEEKVRIEPNCFMKFNNFIDSSKTKKVAAKEASGALMNYIRDEFFNKLLNSKSITFCIPQELDLIWEEKESSDEHVRFHSDLVEAIYRVDLDIKHLDLETVSNSLNRKNKVTDFYGLEYVYFYKIENINNLSYLQKLVLRKIYDHFTKLAGPLRPIVNSTHSREVKKVQTENEIKGIKEKYTKIRNDLEATYRDAINLETAFLYEQLYFNVEDFVEMES